MALNLVDSIFFPRRSVVQNSVGILYANAAGNEKISQAMKPIPGTLQEEELRFKRRIGLWFCAPDKLSRKNRRRTRFPISAKHTGRRFMPFCAIAVTRLLKRRILSKVFSPICLSKIH